MKNLKVNGKKLNVSDISAALYEGSTDVVTSEIVDRLDELVPKYNHAKRTFPIFVLMPESLRDQLISIVIFVQQKPSNDEVKSLRDITETNPTVLLDEPDRLVKLTIFFIFSPVCAVFAEINAPGA